MSNERREPDPPLNPELRALVVCRIAAALVKEYRLAQKSERPAALETQQGVNSDGIGDNDEPSTAPSSPNAAAEPRP